ncbi:ABC transporter substrate-binding protein [Hydrogenophaga crassostreae]|uniref:ABC transporter substrate-binding protein n=1 Tax=Hydrogenophaga crassostreae TaxID=1763535 RepID=A0A167IQM9_9BURK|nr:ABC transporter substrate-binding protein [Hydrogenophaga crassostreae]AOW15831.1 ABC transporter substrate-binding protein [Hydrogenophaga crassostreae]OAD43368.1 ABC transporter substrate-binding protein [Hydrogenophaga crassostreae]
MRRGLVPLVMAAGSAGVQAGKANDTLIYASDSEVENVSPYHNNMREGVILASMAWDTLIYRDTKTGDLKPQLATAWKWETPTALNVTLRQGVQFHNGDKFTADDVLYTFNEVAGPGAKIATLQNTDWIKNVEKLGEYQVRINLNAAFPAALQYLAGPTPIYPAAYYKKVGLEGFSKAPIGTGPYKITAVTPGQGVTMARNANYFKASPVPQPKIGTIKFVVIRDPEARLAQLMTGEVDWIWRVPADQAEQLKAMPNLTVLSGETMRVGYLTINNNGTEPESTPLKDLRVRQAINHAINRKGIADNLIRGGSQPVFAACFRTQAACETGKVVKYDYNPAKAKALLAAAGFTNGFETDLWAYRDREYAEAILGDLSKVGIRARLHFVKYPAMRNETRSGRAPLTFGAWGSFSINDASAFTGNFFKGGPDDTAKDPQTIGLLQTADATVDAAERKAKYAKALQRISEQAFWAPMFSYSTNYAFVSDLKFEAEPDELPRFFTASWK